MSIIKSVSLKESNIIKGFSENFEFFLRLIIEGKRKEEIYHLIYLKTRV